MRGKAEPIIEGKKKCTYCLETKELSDFYKSSGNNKGIKPFCKGCSRKAKHKQRHKDIGKTREKERLAHRRNKEQRQNFYRHKHYGLTVQQWESMVVRQGNACAICRGTARNGRPLCVDHNHKTGAVRDLLCERCNLIVGWVEKKDGFIYGLMSAPVTAYAEKWGIL